MDEVMSKLTQIISLCWWLQTHTTLVTQLTLNGNRDFISVKVVNSNGVEKYYKSISALTKKHDPILIKELDQITNNLIILKDELENE